ncbi:MAG TPA: MoaD/ThiS family protein [Thermoanaerobaculia bacterium]|nr:MoaD/ThiS family protein [Thermoanaerobaculia bacterium]
MKVRILYFAILRDITGRSDSELTLPEGTRAGEVWTSMRRQYAQLAAYEPPPLIAVNEAYARPETVLRDGDELAFIPPVAGG